jgi:phosphate transport system substrate-binding protein
MGAALSLALIAAACGEDPNNPGNGGTGVAGDIFISGSSTVEPITALVAEKFAAENPNVAFNVEGPGTSDGFELFCNGETDVQDASRAISDEEIQACESNGVEYVELYVAIDGLSVLTSPENSAVTCLAFSDLYALLGPESQGFESWSDADSLGEEIDAPNVPYPDAPLVVTAPGEESGTYDSFVELALAKEAEQRVEAKKITEEQAGATRKDYQASPNDNVIIEGIAGNPSSLGWVGFAFADQNKDKVKLLPIAKETGSDFVQPTAESIADNSYPLSRPLFIYVNKAKVDANPALKAFIDYYVSDEGLQNVTEADYVAVNDETKTKTRSTWDAKTVGTRQS